MPEQRHPLQDRLDNLKAKGKKLEALPPSAFAASPNETGEGRKQEAIDRNNLFIKQIEKEIKAPAK